MFYLGERESSVQLEKNGLLRALMIRALRCVLGMAQMGLSSSPARWWAARCCGTGREAGVGQPCKGGFGRCEGRSLLPPGELVAVGTFLSCDSCFRLRIGACSYHLLFYCPPGTFLRFWKPEVQDQELVHFEGHLETIISAWSMPSLCPVFTPSSFYPVVCVRLQMSHL